MKKLIKRGMLIILPLLFISFSINAQTYQLIASEFNVSGTSTLHDWTMTSKNATGSATIHMDGNNLSSINKVDVNIKSTSLKSGKSTMDDIAHESLKAKKHPHITFKLTKVNSIKKGNNYIVEAVGTLSIAGASKTISLTSEASENNKSIKFTGKESLKMTDFKIDPPTAMFGTIKTGDAITVDYTLIFKTN